MSAADADGRIKGVIPSVVTQRELSLSLSEMVRRLRDSQPVVWVSVPTEYLSLRERIVERLTGWARLGVEAGEGVWVWREWARDVRRAEIR